MGRIKKQYGTNFTFFEGKNWGLIDPTLKSVRSLQTIKKTISGDNKRLSLICEIATSRKNHKVQIVEDENSRYFLKYFSTDYPLLWNRKLELSIKEALLPYAKRSFNGSFLLWKAGIPTAKPFGYYFNNEKPWKRSGVFVSEVLESDGELRHYQNHEKFDELLVQAARITRSIHDAGLRHTDLVVHNFMVKGIETPNPALYVIDTDKVHQTFWTKPFPSIKQFYDLFCIRGLILSKTQMEIFLNAYFGNKKHEIWHKIILFWKFGGFDPLKWNRTLRKKKSRTVEDNS